MEKKIEVQIEGKTIRIMPHQLKDAMKFGASEIKRQTRNVPVELLNIPAKAIIPPDLSLDKSDSGNLPIENGSEKSTDTNPLESVKMETTKTKKAPIKRNTKKK